MSAERDAPIAAALLQLRDPLSRIQLTAGRLLRDGLSPQARQSAKTIEDAVREIDDGIESALAALSPPEAAAALEPCAIVVDEVRERAAAVFAALECSCEPWHTDAAAEGDGHRMRRGALQLLRAALRWTGRGGSLRIGACREGGRYGIRLEAHRAPNAAGPGADALDALRTTLLGQGGRLETETEAGQLAARLWFEAPEPPA